MPKNPTRFRFAVAQMNPTVGDFSANLKKMLAWVERAEQKNADLVIFPELAVSGYPVWDLANKNGFLAESLKSVEKVAAATRNKKVSVVSGFIDRGGTPDGRNVNALAWIRNGKIQARQAKRLLPTYDVFLEDIFFEAGSKSKVIAWNHLKVGPTICEDIWDSRYSTKPLQDLHRQGADLILNISASPYYQGVAEVRDKLLKGHTRRYGLPILYVNQVGGQDDLIFDGRSFFVDSNGRVLFRAPAFHEDLFFFDWNAAEKKQYEVPLAASTSTPGEVYQALVLGIRDYCRKNGFTRAVIGLSGGIDSALVAALAADALGPGAVLGVTMPGTYSSRGSWEDSEKLARNLEIEFRVRPIREKYDFFMKLASERKSDPKIVTPAMENLQARLRGLELMYISNDEGRLLLSTGNKSELAMGYCTLYGDMAGGLAVIGDVYKTDVYRLAWHRNRQKEVIPKNILVKAPSAELRPNQKDEDSLPKYEILDEILYLYIEKNKSRDEMISVMKKKKIPAALVEDVIRRVDHNEYKRRQTPPILRVTEKAWFGRRMPITNRFQG